MLAEITQRRTNALLSQYVGSSKRNKQHQQKTKTQQQLNSQIQRTEVGVEGG